MTDKNDNRQSGGIGQLVECPRCGHEFELSETFRAQFEAEKRREINIALRDNEAKILAEAEKAKQAAVAESAEKAEALQAKLEADRKAQEKREKQLLADAKQAKEAALAESAEQVKTLEAQLKADKQAQEKREKQLLADAKQAKEAALAEIRDEFDLEREEHRIEKQRIEEQAAKLQRQLRQGAVELQGEALEEYLKKQLLATFPLDKIDDIQRGRFGADLTQEVLDEQFQNCGILVWEAKRTMHWNDQWLAKIKDDADRVGAHLRIIVSEALPPDIRIFDLREGVWISSLQGALPLARALRSQLIESARLQRAGQGKGLKMDAIYQYLTSPRFSERIQRMADTWKALKEQVDTEERAMQRQWKTRRKQLDRMQNATLEMYTDFEAILGREIPQVPGLELEALPPSDDVEEHSNEIIKLPSATKD